MMSGSGGMAYGGIWLMFLVGLVLVVLLGVAVFLALRAGNFQPSPPARMAEPTAQSARDVLDLRLARGEITPEEYSNARPLLDA
jgi:uncharacterized membrane protein